MNVPRLVFANSKGKVFDHPGLEGAGMKAGEFFRLDPGQFVPLPDSSELFMLPDRLPVGWDGERFVTLEEDPYSHKKEACFAVGAFIPPGYTLTHNTAFHEKSGAAMLPLFAYAACVFYKDKFYAAAIRVDRSFRHDDRFMNTAEIRKNIVSFDKLFPKNRLIGHLGNCATVNACANAKNFFLGKYEAPIPTSPVCNAQCQGCISFQPADRISSTQTRIQFTPTPEEIAELACFHIERAPNSIVSFGQGCEGEPLLAAETIEKAIRKIRSHTSKGSLNINTNASRPQAVARLFDAGLNTIRVSANSVREPYYSRYYQPRGYSLKEVTESVDVAKKCGGFVSMNYLSMPGFTDSKEEFEALGDFITQHRVDMIQWRNLNYDPLHYFKDLKLEKENLKMVGMAEVIGSIQKKFPKILSGYFNPKKFSQVLACLMILVSVLGSAAFGEVELRVTTKDIEFTEPKTDNRLRILCPTCLRALYVCGVEELLIDDTPNGEYTRQMLATCRPLIEGLPERLFVGGPPIICPYDGGRSIRMTGVNPYGHRTGKFFTNRGWQPVRKNPKN